MQVAAQERWGAHFPEGPCIFGWRRYNINKYYFIILYFILRRREQCRENPIPIKNGRKSRKNF